MRVQEKATKWHDAGAIDGLTTNGILIVHPVDGFSENGKPGLWREVSVGGGIYALRESRYTPQKNSLVSDVALHTNITIVDAATVLYRLYVLLSITHIFIFIFFTLLFFFFWNLCVPWCDRVQITRAVA